MLEQPEQLKARTKRFAVRIVKLYRAINASDDGRTFGRQILRSASSVAANYRAVCRARSRREFISKIGTVVEEMDESVFWLELLVETGICRAERMGPILREANELLAIFGASQRTAKLHARNTSEQSSMAE